MKPETVFSPDRVYRYVLGRQVRWDFDARIDHPKYVMFVGLNPSTADEHQDDPTVRRCTRFAQDWGYDALCMMNIFAYRSTDPEKMKLQKDPIGPENDEWLLKMAAGAEMIVAAWGTHGEHLDRHRAVCKLLKGRLSCLRVTVQGYPQHPLYLPKTLVPIPYQ